MKAGVWALRLAAVGGLVWCVAAFLRGCGPDLIDGPLRRDFNRRPPEAAFDFVFGQPVSAGVEDLRATGEAWIAGSNVWLRFRAPEPVVRTLLTRYQREPFDRRNLQDVQEVWGPRLKDYDPTDRIGWDDLYKAVRVECFGKRSGGGTDRTVYWDRGKGVVYVFLVGI
jgi:hypothetical protein